jgi:hypothetical protein
VHVPADAARLRALHEAIAGFYVHDRTLLRAQSDLGKLLEREKPVPEQAVRRYLDAVERYFSSFSGEAQTQLAKLERRLAEVSQLQYNLTAERGVAVKRVAATQGVLTVVAELRRQ